VTVGLTGEERGRRLAMFADRVAGYADVDADYGRRWRDWCRSLLVHGGELVVPPRGPETDLEALLAGAAEAGARTRAAAGEPGDCHQNVAAAWIDGTIAAIGTGYALSDDGLWRQHSWGLDADGTLVETTDPRMAYVGIVLPAGAPSMQFAGSNATAHLKKVLAERGPRAAELIGLIRELRR
jgi:hypothetical protein